MTRPTKGWAKRAPKKTSVRKKMQTRCSPGCFLVPGTKSKRPKYPVCPKSSCRPTCRGTLAAYKRARQQHNNVVAKKAIRKGKRLNCAWAKEH